MGVGGFDSDLLTAEELAFVSSAANVVGILGDCRHQSPMPLLAEICRLRRENAALRDVRFQGTRQIVYGGERRPETLCARVEEDFHG